LTNDIFSYEKEARAGDPLNLVHLLMHHHGCTLDDAVARAAAVHNDVVTHFDDVAAAVERRSPALRVYVEGHRRWMRGAFDWQMQAHRYRPELSAAPSVQAA